MTAGPSGAPPGGPRVLVVDDEPTLRRGLVRLLAARGCVAEGVEDGAEAVRLAREGAVEVMLVDVIMPRMSGLEVLEQVKQVAPLVEVVMMTAHGDVDTAVAAVKAGAYDFLTKPFASPDAAVIAVQKAAEHKRLLRRTRELEEALAARAGFGEILGASERMKDVYRLVEGVASSRSTVLVLGESGTGKELIARAIHQRSMRAARAFVVVNCGAIPAELVESELFGHAKGAFSGAISERKGLFEAADGGTIFLDEVGDLPPPAQVKLLRVLQQSEVRPVGTNEPRVVDVRVVAATNVDLRGRIREGRFREDLFYRLNVISLVLPPLRDRREDIPLLASHFVRKYAARAGRDVRGIAPAALDDLVARPWPGNVRELENAIERAVVLARGDVIEPQDLPEPEGLDASARSSTSPPGVNSVAAALPPAADAPLDGLPYVEARRQALLAFDRSYVQAVLARTGGNISQAARAAGLDRSNFKRVLRRASGAGDGDDVA